MMSLGYKIIVFLPPTPLPNNSTLNFCQTLVSIVEGPVMNETKSLPFKKKKNLHMY